MARVREHINGLDLTNLIAAFTKDGGVTGKRGRSAGNVDDAFGTHGKDGVKNGPLTAGSWRIKDNDVGADSVPHKKGQLFSRISTDEFTVFDVIVPGIFFWRQQSLVRQSRFPRRAVPFGREKG